jgi:hypothetical protein
MLRLLLFLFLIYILLRLTRGLWTRLRQAFKTGLFSARDYSASRKPGAKPKQIIDEMRPCVYCGTYHPSRHSYQKKGLYFCNPQCHEAYQREKP